MKRIKILLTGSNPNAKKNVAGIGTVIKVLEKNTNIEPITIPVGRSSGEKRGVSWIISLLKKKIEVKSIIKNNKIDVGHINTCMNPPALLRDYYILKQVRKHGIKTILHIHGGKYLFKKTKNIFLKYIIDRMLVKSDLIIVLSEYEKEHFPYNISKTKIEVLKNCIDTKQIPNHLPNSQKANIIYMGRIVESKGIEDLCIALKLLAEKKIDFHFNLCGSGPLQTKIVEQLKSIIPEKFTFHGIVSGDKKWSLLSQSEIFILPSRWGEGLPMALLEAMALGKCAVVTNDASMKMIIKDRQNGILVKKHNPDDIFKKLKELLTTKDIPNEVGQRAKKYFQNNFSLKEYYHGINNLYNRLLN
ncbi:glycosyltransferase family 4 protein [Marinifilum sp.]|uniref:glycosyltransferase family 4 protein n=1 Tax=Marinifilum sp. TaxID=2033137 RepID=UPI003BAD8051